MKFNREEFEKLITDVENNVTVFNDISDNIVNEYCSDLDATMREIYINVINVDYPSTDTIEKYFLQLTSIIYFTIEKVEKLGIYDDISKISFKEAYNNSYIDSSTTTGINGKKLTTGELAANAENATINESTLNSIYSRSYKIFKSKVDSAQTMVSTLSKVLSKRMQEDQFTSATEFKQERKILNETL